MREDVNTLRQTAMGEEFLEHFGVKGMRWGVRNTSATSSKTPKMSKTRDTKGNLLTKDDAKWNKKVANVRKGMSAYNKTADTMNAVVIPKINNDPKYKNVDFNNPKNASIQKKYLAEYKAAFEKEFNKNLRSVYGDSPSGKYKVRLSSDSEEGLWTVDYNEMQHSDDFSFSVLVKKNNLGQITSFEIKDDKLIQSDMSEKTLAHFGVKGMRWGVRRQLSTTDSSSTVKKDNSDGTSLSLTKQQSKTAKAGSAFIAALQWSPVSKETRKKLTRSPIKPISKLQDKQDAFNKKLVNKVLR